jgi:hypothetical protein
VAYGSIKARQIDQPACASLGIQSGLTPEIALAPRSARHVDHRWRRFVMLLASVLFGVSLFLVAVEAPAAPADRSHFNAAACPTPTIGAFRQPELGPTITCGYLTVPRNHARPDGPTIKIAVGNCQGRVAEPRA